MARQAWPALPPRELFMGVVRRLCQPWADDCCGGGGGGLRTDLGGSAACLKMGGKYTRNCGSRWGVPRDIPKWCQNGTWLAGGDRAGLQAAARPPFRPGVGPWGAHARGESAIVAVSGRLGTLPLRPGVHPRPPARGPSLPLSLPPSRPPRPARAPPRPAVLPSVPPSRPPARPPHPAPPRPAVSPSVRPSLPHPWVAKFTKSLPLRRGVESGAA